MHCGIYLSKGKIIAEFPKEWKGLQASFRNPVYWKKSEAEVFDCVILEGDTHNCHAITEFYEGLKVPIYWYMENGQVDFGAQKPCIIKKSYQGIQEGMWQGQDVVIIGGGPSVLNIPTSFYAGKKVIGINRAFEFYKCDIIFGTDRRWMTWIIEGKYGEEARERWATCKGKKIILRGSKYPVKEKDIVVFDPYKTASTFSTSLEEGLTRYSNSGIPALNLAILLGAKRIFLVGFDCQKTENGMQNHFHSGHPEKQKDNVFEAFIKSFKQFAPLVPKDIEVFNMNPKSGIKDFPFYTDHLGAVLQTIPTTNPPAPQQEASPHVLFVTAYTPDYAELAASLRGDFEKFNLNHEIIPFDDTGKWLENCNLKSYVMKCVRQEYPESILVWVDADARIKQNPDLFFQMNGADVAYHTMDNKVLASGTLAFLPTEKGNKLLDTWASACEKNPRIFDQVTLADCVKELNPKIHHLPEEYCRIFDRKTPCDFPVIVHYQESRNRKKREKATK